MKFAQVAILPNPTTIKMVFMETYQDSIEYSIDAAAAWSTIFHVYV